MRPLIEFTRIDDCPCCNASKSIECYDVYDKPINYTYLLDQYEKDKDVLNRLNNKVLSYMKCRNCNTKFVIYWGQNREIPIPMNTRISDIFFDSFIKIYK